MANADQLKALLKSHFDGDSARFHAVAMQVAAREAKRGHGKLAEDIRTLVDQARLSPAKSASRKTVPIGQPRGELADILTVSHPKLRLADMTLSDELANQLQRILREQRHATHILEHGLSPRRKLLLVGPPGTGKTMTASVLAGELGWPLCQVRLDGLITKYMGETAAKLRQVFDAIQQTRGVYFFDEFDAIGSQRGLTNDVGEARRILNSFLKMIEQDASHSLIIGATNHHGILDNALFRRFDDLLHYELPDEAHVVQILKARLATKDKADIDWSKLAKRAQGLSYAELTRAADEVLKTHLMEGAERLVTADVLSAIEERRQIADKLSARETQ